MEGKVFCIGFQKTGTKTMAKALRMLGYRVTGPNGNRLHDVPDALPRLTTALLRRFDAFQDNPWPVLYEEMDRRCPGSKFILTIRDPEDWVRSVVSHFGTRWRPMREKIYGHGSPVGHELEYRERYERHVRQVLEYFRDRHHQLLVMNLGEGDGWEKLCPFLEKDIPTEGFPHENRKAGGKKPSGAWPKGRESLRVLRQRAIHGRRDLYNLARYGRSAPRRFELIYVNPARINHYVANRAIARLAGEDRNSASGIIVDWSRVGQMESLYDQQKYKLCERHWRDGLSWEEIGYYEFMAGTNKWGRCSRLEISKRCDKLDAVFEETKISRALLTRRQLSPANFREEGGILVHIGTDGEPVFGGNGFHRLSIAKILGLDRIPACVGVVDRLSLEYFRAYRSGVTG